MRGAKHRRTRAGPMRRMTQNIQRKKKSASKGCDRLGIFMLTYYRQRSMVRPADRAAILASKNLKNSPARAWSKCGNTHLVDRHGGDGGGGIWAHQKIARDSRRHVPQPGCDCRAHKKAASPVPPGSGSIMIKFIRSASRKFRHSDQDHICERRPRAFSGAPVVPFSSRERLRCICEPVMTPKVPAFRICEPSRL